MSKNLLIPGFHFEKRAGRTVRGGRTEWEREAMDMLSEEHPYVLESNPEFEIEWDDQDPENGMGRGKIVVWSREPLPAATSTEMGQMKQQGITDPGKAVTIPIFVKDFELQDIDTFVTDEGAVNRLSEKRWSEVMGNVGEMGVIDPHTNVKELRQQAPTYNLPYGAAGWDRQGYQGFGTMEKVSAENQFPLLKFALRELDPYDQERLRDLASKEAMVSGFGANRLIPLVKVMLATSPRTLSDVEDAAYDQLPPSLVFVEEIPVGPTSTRSGKYRATIVSDRMFKPSIVEGDYTMICETLRGIVPDIDDRMRVPGDFVVDLNGRTEVKPIVLEDLSLGAESVMGSGNWLCCDHTGTLLQLDAYMNVHQFDGEVSGHKLFVGNGYWAMATKVAGRKLGAVGETSGECCVTSGLHVKRGDWISICCGEPSAPGCQVMEPAQVVYCGPCRGSGLPSQLDIITRSGEEISIRFAPVLKLAPANGVKWPDVQLSHGYAKFLAPLSCRIMKLGRMTTLEELPVRVNRLIESYMRSGGTMSEADGRVRFTAGTDAESPAHVKLKCYGKDDFCVAGQLVKGVTGQDVVQNAGTAAARFILCVLGCTPGQADDLLSRCERGGGETIRVAGLRPIQRSLDADGTRKVPFFRKAAALAVQLRDAVPDEERDTLFKAAAAIPILALSTKVASLLEDEEVVRQMGFFNSVVPRFVEAGAVEKLAANFSDPESIDVMLGINALNERNVRGFLAKLGEMRTVEDNLAELSMMSKLGLAGVEVADVTEALDSIGRVNESLEHLQAQLTQDKITLS